VKLYPTRRADTSSGLQYWYNAGVLWFQGFPGFVPFNSRDTRREIMHTP